MKNFQLNIKLNEQERDDLIMGLLGYMQKVKEGINTKIISRKAGKSQIADLLKLIDKIETNSEVI